MVDLVGVRFMRCIDVAEEVSEKDRNELVFLLRYQLPRLSNKFALDF